MATMSPPSVLYLMPTDGWNYMDLFLYHGMYELIGYNAVDFPKNEPLWNEDGSGQGCSGMLALTKENKVKAGRADRMEEPDRTDILTKIHNGYFDLILISNRCSLTDLIHAAIASRSIVAEIEGEDGVHGIKYPKADFRFSRSGHEGILLPFSVAKKLITKPDYSRKKFDCFTQMVMSNKQRGWINGLPGVYVGTERLPFPEYFKKLQSAKCGVSAAGAGWDTPRHWEIGAAGAIPIISSLHYDIPNMFNLLHYSDRASCEFAIKQVAELSEEKWTETITKIQKQLKKYHTTEERAKYVIGKCLIR